VTRVVDGVDGVEIRPAAAADLPAVRALLTGADLPLDGVDGAFDHGVVAVEHGDVVGAAAIEPYVGGVGMLRSVVVEAPLRGTGVGRRLVAEAERQATGLGVTDLYLLTETAADWFPRLGYGTLPRDAAPPSVAGSIEFTVSCVDTGVLMWRRLDAGRGRRA
jgi:amino-acid N-acetyltransferase